MWSFSATHTYARLNDKQPPQTPLDQDFPKNEVRHYSASATSDPVNASCDVADFPEKSRSRERKIGLNQVSEKADLNCFLLAPQVQIAGRNPSNTKHYLSGLRFASAVWTRKVETAHAEIKGSISEIELKPGGQAEWYFVPVKAGSFKFGCTIPSHREAGMLGNITIM